LFTLLASAPCLLPDSLHVIPYPPTDLTCLGISALAVSQYRDGCIGTLVIFGLTRCKNVEFIKVVVHSIDNVDSLNHRCGELILRGSSLVLCRFLRPNFFCSASSAADKRIAHVTHPDLAVLTALKDPLGFSNSSQTRHFGVERLGPEELLDEADSAIQGG
jgi:hypothetical protein